MAKLFLLSVLIIAAALQPVRAQLRMNGVLLTELPKSIYCDREPLCVAAAGFRILETIAPGFRPLDTVWLYITCPENFSPGFWAAGRTYELDMNADTSSVRRLPRLSMARKRPIGVVETARRINLR